MTKCKIYDENVKAHFDTIVQAISQHANFIHIQNTHKCDYQEFLFFYMYFICRNFQRINMHAHRLCAKDIFWQIHG